MYPGGTGVPGSDVGAATVGWRFACSSASRNSASGFGPLPGGHSSAELWAQGYWSAGMVVGDEVAVRWADVTLSADGADAGCGAPHPERTRYTTIAIRVYGARRDNCTYRFMVQGYQGCQSRRTLKLSCRPNHAEPALTTVRIFATSKKTRRRQRSAPAPCSAAAVPVLVQLTEEVR